MYMDGYWKGIRNSRKQEHLIEECYCDLQRLKLLLEHYEAPDIEEGFREIQNRSFLTKYWPAVIKKIPSDQSFSDISESDLPNIERKRLVDILILKGIFA